MKILTANREVVIMMKLLVIVGEMKMDVMKVVIKVMVVIMVFVD